MRRNNQAASADDEAQIDLTPMLDVVFIMLIFFIVTASFIKEAGVEVNRPEASTSERKKARKSTSTKPSFASTTPQFPESRPPPTKTYPSTSVLEQPSTSSIVQTRTRFFAARTLGVKRKDNLANLDSRVKTLRAKPAASLR